MAWPVDDFDLVRFDEGDGAAEVAAVHLAIMERAQLTKHSLADGDYAAPYTGTVWISRSEGDVSRTYLYELLEKFYADIILLLEGDANIRWTETAGAGATWNIGTLATDIGMGAFGDLLNNPQDPAPFMWLHEALNRIIYPQIDLAATGGTYTVRNGAGYTSRQTAWDHRGDNSASVSVPTFPLLKWDTRRVGSNFEAYIFDQFDDVVFPTADYVGTLDEAYYKYSWLWNNTVGGLSITVAVGTESFTATATVSTSYRATTDAVIGTDTIVDMDFVTTEPATVPFFSISGQGGFLQMGVGLRIHLSIASELTDQA